jgi:hypothetical protein
VSFFQSSLLPIPVTSDFRGLSLPLPNSFPAFYWDKLLEPVYRLRKTAKDALRQWELGLSDFKRLSNKDGIYPYWVYDGGITIGYGHYISPGDVKND